MSGISLERSILYINSATFHGGSEEVLLEYIKVSKSMGFIPVLVVPDTGWITHECERQYIPVEIIPSLPKPFSYSKWYHFRTWLWNAIQIARIARKWNALLIHSNSAKMAFHGGLGARIAGIHSIVHVHDLLYLPYSSWIMRTVLSLVVDETICVSNAVFNLIIAENPNEVRKIHTIYNGIDQNVYSKSSDFNLREKYHLPFGSTVIGSVSVMNRTKGQDILIKAFSLVHRDNPDVFLVIVGGATDNPDQIIYETLLRKMVVEFELQDKVIFTGWSEEVPSFIKNFDLFVHTPIVPESLPTVLIHASALGIPMVGANIGGIPEIIENGTIGLLVKPGDPNELANAIIRLLSQPDLRSNMSLAAKRKYEENFTYQIMEKNLSTIYSKYL